MAWTEDVSKRTLRGKIFVDGHKRAFCSSMSPFHYEGTIDSGVFDSELDMSPTYVNNAQLDGWLVTQNGWHYALGHPSDKTSDGWVGFGGRGGQNWIKFRLTRVGYLHYPTRAWNDIGGLPNYDRANLSSGTIPQIIKPTDQIINSSSRTIWKEIWTTPGGGGVDIEWLISGDRLKENVTVNQSARDWIKINRPPVTAANETYFGFVFQIDPSDIPKWMKNGIVQDINSDFDDSDGQIETYDSVDRLLGFMPISDVVVRSDNPRPFPYEHSRGQVTLRKRIWKGVDGNHYLLVGCRCDFLNNLYEGDLKFDPTWGQTDIQANTDDGNEDANDDSWYVNGNGYNTFWCSEVQVYNEWSGLSWQMPAIVSGATIEKFYVRAYCNSQQGTVNMWVAVEDADPDTNTYFQTGHVPSNSTLIWTSAAQSIADVGNTWYFGESDTKPINMASALSSLLSSYGAIASGDRVNIIFKPDSGSDYMGFDDYSISGNDAQLYIAWTEGETLNLTGTINTVNSLTSSLYATRNLSDSISSAFSTAGILRRIMDLSDIISSESSLSAGTIYRIMNLSDSIYIISDISGSTIYRIIDIADSISVVTSLSGILITPVWLVGTSDTVSDVSGGTITIIFTLPSSGGLAFGEEDPELGEVGSPWTQWSDGDGGLPTITGNQNWGLLSLETSEEGRSAVYDFGDEVERTYVLTLNRYGSGSGSPVVQVRGQSTTFNQDDVSPSWETYSIPVAKTWRYVQVRIIYS